MTLLLADSDLSATLVQLLPGLGQTAGILVALFYFLMYSKDRDRQHLEAMNRLRDDFLAAFREIDIRHQATTSTLFTLSRETVQTVGSLSGSIADLSRSVSEQRQAIQELRQMIHSYDPANRTGRAKPGGGGGNL